MPISRYEIVCATHPSELNDLMTAGGYLAIGYIYSQPSYGLQAVGVGSIEPWGSVTDYELVQAQFYHDLIPLVNEKIAQGFQPIGGLAGWANAFVQAVGKIDSSGSSGGANPSGDYLEKSKNLSDVSNAKDSRKNLNFPVVAKGYNLMGFSTDESGTPAAVKLDLDHWVGGYAANTTDPITAALIVNINKAGRINGYRVMSDKAQATSIAVRASDGRLAVGDATEDEDAVNLGQLRDATGFKGWTNTPLTDADVNAELVPIAMTDDSGKVHLQSYRQSTAAPFANAIAMRDAEGRMQVSGAVLEQDVVPLKQVNALLEQLRKEIEQDIVRRIDGALGK